MTEIKGIYDNHVDDLVKSLPMDDTHFITKLSSQQLLPGDTESKIKSFSTQSEKASYFLSHVIKPALDINDTSDFNKLLSVMQECGYNHVVNLSSKITHEIDELKSGMYVLMYVHVANSCSTGNAQVPVLQLICNTSDTSKFAQNLTSKFPSVYIVTDSDYDCGS